MWQDNAPFQKAKTAQKWSEENNGLFDVLTWPPNSSDLESNEHLWDVPDKAVWSVKAWTHVTSSRSSHSFLLPPISMERATLSFTLRETSRTLKRLPPSTSSSIATTETRPSRTRDENDGRTNTETPTSLFSTSVTRMWVCAQKNVFRLKGIFAHLIFLFLSFLGSWRLHWDGDQKQCAGLCL